MDKTTNNLKTKQLKALTLENACLQDENDELREMIGLMQEKIQQRFTLRNHHRRTQSLSPPRRQGKVTKDPKKIQQCQQIVGEIAFQLDRRILCAIFLEERRLYGYRVADIDEKIKQVTTCALNGKVDEELRSKLNLRYRHTMDRLKESGYDPTVHPHVTEYLVNTYGVINEQSNGNEKPYTLTDVQFLRKMITEYMPGDKVKDILVILKCLAYLVKQDGKCTFLW